MPLKALSRHKFTGRTVVFLVIASLVLLFALSTLEPLVFLNLPGLLVIVLGTIGVSILSHSMDACVDAFKQLTRENKSERNVSNDANIILHFAQLWFRNQYIQIDRDLAKLDKPFLKKGLQMIRDRQPNDDILALLNWQISQVNYNEGKHIAVFRSMANHAPILGMVGTILALINMVYLLEQGSAISEVASLMGFALVSTFYGLMFASFVFKPMIARLESRRLNEVRYITLLAEGIILINEKRTPALIRETLMTYIQSMQAETVASSNSKNVSRKNKKPMLLKFGLQRSS